ALLKDPKEAKHNAIFNSLIAREIWDPRVLDLAYKFVNLAIEKDDKLNYLNSIRYVLHYPLNTEEKSRALKVFRPVINHKDKFIRLYAFFAVALCTDNWTPCLDEFSAILNHSINGTERLLTALLLVTINESNATLDFALEHRIRNEKSSRVLAAVGEALANRNNEKAVLEILRRRFDDIRDMFSAPLKRIRFSNSKAGIQLFESKHVWLRKIFCEVVGSYEAPSPATQERLSQALNDPDIDVQVFALDSYKRFTPSPKALSRILELTRSKFVDIQAPAFLAMKRAAPSQASLTRLLEGLEHPIGRVRKAALRALPNQITKANAEIYQSLVPLFQREKNLSIREDYLLCLRLSCPSPENLVLLIESFLREESKNNPDFLSDIRDMVDAGYSFSQLGELLKPLLKNERAVMRSHALLTYGVLGQKARPFLNVVNALKTDSKVEVRFTASVVSAILNAKEKQALELIRKGLEAEQDLVRLRAISCLGFISKIEDSDIDALIKLLDDRWWNIRCLAIEELGRIGPKARKAAAILEKKYWSFGETCRTEADLTLRKIRGPQ
ncbi:MAG: HEAT repeat domain-containing protein, partial [Planctomycetota bacterium]|nr:HEAT repeat domain-containing protein [Planctomycetota bacterium]